MNLCYLTAGKFYYFHFLSMNFFKNSDFVLDEFLLLLRTEDGQEDQ